MIGARLCIHRGPHLKDRQQRTLCLGTDRFKEERSEKERQEVRGQGCRDPRVLCLNAFLVDRAILPLPAECTAMVTS